MSLCDEIMKNVQPATTMYDFHGSTDIFVNR